MTACPFGHTEVQERDGKRICLTCRAKYQADSGRRKQLAIKNNQNGRKRVQGKRNNNAAQHRINTKKHVQLRQNAETLTNVSDTRKEISNERDDYKH